jgi:Subtilase family/CARDB
MFTDDTGNISQISGNPLYLDEQNPLSNQLFHRELALNSYIPTSFDLDRIDRPEKTQLSRYNEIDSPATGTGVDLIVKNLSASPTAALGQYLDLSYTIANKGGDYAVSSVTRFYLSKDISLDSTDVYLGLDAVTPLMAKSNRTETASIYFNNNISSGAYYLLVQADGYNFVTETNENNNLAYQSIQVIAGTKPDLIVKYLTTSSPAAIATQLDFSYTLTNAGNHQAETSVTKFYLSDNLTLENSDRYLGADFVASLEAGTTTTQSASVYLNDSLRSGTYYLLVQADGYASVVESNENNNIYYQTLQILDTPKPDLLINTISLPPKVAIGTQLNFSYTLSNEGNNEAGANYTKFYLSKDAVLNGSDTYLKSEYVNNLQAATTDIESASVKLNNILNPGTYYLFAASDGDNSVIESKETNNITYQKITITNPDSIYSSITGYGLINAAAAIAKVLGEDLYPNVSNLGGKEWDADLINVPEVWAQGYTGQGIIVAVLDTGVDRYHNDLSENIWHNEGEIADNGLDDDGNGYIDDTYGWNFIQNTNNTLDVKGHGTHVAGTIASVQNNLGATGIAHGAKIMPVKVLNDQGAGNWSAVAQGIRYAVDNGARVINLSLSGIIGNSELQNAVKYASERDAIVVMAAGNSGGSKPQYPASYALHWGLAVGGVDKHKKFTAWSNKAGNHSNMAYLTAPGAGIYSTLPNNKYGFSSGTSMAAPQVSGVVALLLSADDGLTDSQIREILTTTAGNNLMTTGNFSLLTGGHP